jgi:hypothetical protein
MPTFTTTISHPLAVGEFTLVTNGSSDKMPSPWTPSLAPEDSEMIAKHLSKWKDWGARSPKTEQILYIGIESDWFVSKTRTVSTGYEKIHVGGHWIDKELYTEVPFAMGRNAKLFAYRSPLTGWIKEEVAVSYITRDSV